MLEPGNVAGRNRTPEGELDAVRDGRLRFRKSSRVLVIGTQRAVFGVIAIGLSPMATEIPLLVVGVASGLVCFASAFATLRSKVTADRAALHIRGTLGWRHLTWSSILDFHVEPRSTRVGTVHTVLILRCKGRSLRPFALAAETDEDAHFNVELLKAFHCAP